MLPPLHTPHSTIAPRMSVRATYLVAEQSASIASALVFVCGWARRMTSIVRAEKSAG
jgi:hypothetical protein